MYLVKMQRCSGNHQYIHCASDDEDIAYFLAKVHTKFVRPHKYDYSIEHIPMEGKVYIVSWENKDESLHYVCYWDKELSKTPDNVSENYRFREYELKSITAENAAENLKDEIENYSDYWYYFEGKELLGLKKVYESYRKNIKFKDFDVNKL